MSRPVDVLVAGAGPVGLTVAHELARRGLGVRLIDAAPGPSPTSRAVATHPRTLETFDQMGVVEAILERGQRIRAFTMFANGRRLVRLDADYGTMPTRYPFTLIVEQADTEAVLRDAVARHGPAVEWGVRLESLREDDDRVHAVLTGPDGERDTCTARWLVGCDGGHSTVRKRLGLTLHGESSETWMLADAPVRCDLPRDSIYWIHTGRQALMMVPFRRDGRWRLLDTTPADPALPAGQIAGRFGEKLAAGLGRDLEVGAAEWTSVFTFQQRMIERMQTRRVFLAGDAAHVHSPASGQGMNTGIQEAYNLAWKLAMVHDGIAAPELLETYSDERVPIGRGLLGSTRKATFLVQLKNALAGVMLPLVFGVIRNVRPIRVAMQRKILGGISGLRLAYPDSPLTTPGATARGPAPGERVSGATAGSPGDPGCAALAEELRDVRWSLVVAGDASGAAADLGRAHGRWLSTRVIGGPEPGAEDGPGRASGAGVLPDPRSRLRRELGLTSGGWILIRPDGYVAARGERLTPAALAGALAHVRLAVPVG